MIGKVIILFKISLCLHKFNEDKSENNNFFYLNFVFNFKFKFIYLTVIFQIKLLAMKPTTPRRKS